MSAKSHTIGCKKCDTPTVCSADADWVICYMCVARGLVDVPKTESKVKVKKISKKITKKGKK